MKQHHNHNLALLQFGRVKGIILLLALCIIFFANVEGFAPTTTTLISKHGTRWAESPLSIKNMQTKESEAEELKEQLTQLWNPSLRRVMGTVATLGALETSFLTYNKLVGSGDLCTVNGNCASVLNGPYATIPFTDIPLAAVGFLAYMATIVLSIGPISASNPRNNDDTWNRIALVGVTTAMGTFSVFLMSLLFGVLHETCPFCIASALFSLTLAGCTWLGGALPQSAPRAGLQTGMASLLVTTFAAVVIFVTTGDTSAGSSSSALADAFSSPPTSGILLASNTAPKEGFAPPPITTASSDRAVILSTQLQALNAKMYGAYWCSHCYDQKEQLGKEAFSRVQYIECSQDGKNSQRSLCQERDVPGYPTWEINGQLFPGERALDELEEIINKAKSAKD